MNCSNLGPSYAFRPSGNTTFQITQIDVPTNCSLKTALALDGAGGVHIAYEGDSYHLRHAYKPAGLPWRAETVDSMNTTSQGGEASIAVGSDGTVHIAYHVFQSASNKFLYYAAKPVGGTWSIAAIDATSDWTGRHTSIALDSQGAIHVGYVDHANDRLRHAYRSPGAGSWVRETVDTAAVVDGTSTTTSLPGLLGIAYEIFDGTRNRVHFAYKCN